MDCAFCPHHNCFSKGQNCLGLSPEQVLEHYDKADRAIMKAAGETESRNFMKMTRLEESLFFLKQIGAKKVGVAFCIGLAQEAYYIAKYFKKGGLQVESICCKNCGVDKDMLQIEKSKPGTLEIMCNPRIQARVLNEAGTEFNFVVGLCVGHDMIFTKASEAPVSVLIAKDRVLANNTAGAVYSKFWRSKLGIQE